MFLANAKVSHESEAHESLARTSLGIAMSQIPAGGLERRLRQASGVILIGVIGSRARGAMSELWVTLAFGTDVFFVTDHAVSTNLRRKPVAGNRS